MIVIVCLDNNNGMSFNSRRQSRDRALTERICNKFAGKKICVAAYSSELFPDNPTIYIDDNFLDNAGKHDVCFVEKEKLMQYEEKIEMLVAYRWNRKYPADVRLDIPLKDSDWKLQEIHDFSGHSHEMITEEVYTR